MGIFSQDTFDSIQEAQEKTVLLELYYYDLNEVYPQDIRVLRIASRACIFPAAGVGLSHPEYTGTTDPLTGDPLANIAFDPYLVTVPTISKSIDGTTTIGNLVIDNTDGFMDDKSNYKFQYFSLYLTALDILKVDTIGVNIITLIHLGKVNGISSIDKTKATLSVGDLREVYAKRDLWQTVCDDTALSYYTDNTDEEEPLPVIIGDVYNIPTLHFDYTGTQRYYQYAQTVPSAAVINLKHGGLGTAVPDSYAKYTTTSCLLVPGTDTVWLDDHGILTFTGCFYTQPHTVDVSGLNYTTLDAANRLGILAKVPISGTASYPVAYEVAYLAKTDSTFGQVMDEILQSTGGYWLVNESQEVEIYQMRSPSSVTNSNLEIHQEEMVNFTITAVEPPVHKVTLNYDKNWSVLSDDEVVQYVCEPASASCIGDVERKRVTREFSTEVGTNNLPTPATTPIAGYAENLDEYDKEVTTYLVNQVDAAAEVTRRLNLRSLYRKKATFTTTLRGAKGDPDVNDIVNRWVRVGDVATIFHNKYGISGQKVLVIDVTMRPTKGLMEMEVWW